MKIISQELKEGYILQVLENGDQIKVLYNVDENGEEYAELFPDDVEVANNG